MKPRSGDSKRRPAVAASRLVNVRVITVCCRRFAATKNVGKDKADGLGLAGRRQASFLGRGNQWAYQLFYEGPSPEDVARPLGPADVKELAERVATAEGIGASLARCRTGGFGVESAANRQRRRRIGIKPALENGAIRHLRQRRK